MSKTTIITVLFLGSIFCLLISGCSDGNDGKNGLVRIAEEPAGPNCTQGGVLVESGMDADDSGTLEPGEVLTSVYICNGGEQAIRVTSALPGGVCATGGIKIETGLDLDGDGVLDDEEVERVQYACHEIVASISAGARHSCALKTDGTVWCWGGNHFGQLGDGSWLDKVTPVQVTGLTDVASISAGVFSTCAVKTDSTVWCWGKNDFGQLGDGAQENQNTPGQVGSFLDAAFVATGRDHTCAMKTDGAVWCWGRNEDGQLGDGTWIDKLDPVQVTGLSDIASISSGDHHSCVLKTNGTAWCWGNNELGQLGDGTLSGKNTPVQVTGLSDAIVFSAGGHHNCAVKTDGSIWCWGQNGLGQLAQGETAHETCFHVSPLGEDCSPIPVQVEDLSDAAFISGGGNHTCMVNTNGTVWCWGYSRSGQMGDGLDTHEICIWDGFDEDCSPLPVQVTGLSDPASISAGGQHNCAQKTDGTAWCWGRNWLGALGDGTTTDQNTPVLVLNFP
jgi:alpha-tubulin suppressor-like RCC1 family protein